MSSNW